MKLTTPAQILAYDWQRHNQTLCELKVKIHPLEWDTNNGVRNLREILHGIAYELSKEVLKDIEG